MPPVPGSELKAKFIRETEHLIDVKRRQVEKLMAEAEEVEAEVLEARQLLHLLRTGEETLPEQRVAEAASNGHGEEPEKKPRKRITRLSQEDLVACLQSIGRREFTAEEAAQVTGMTQSGMLGALNRLQGKGLAKMVKPTGKLVPGVGAEPSKWRVTSAQQ